MGNNKGLSLVEVIVVVAIIAVVAGIVIFSVGSVGNTKLNGAVETLESELAKTRTTALTKESGAELRIKQKDGALYVVDEHGSVQKKISDSSIDFAYQKGNATPVDMVDGNELIIKFDRSSGAFLDTHFPDGSDGECKALILRRKGVTMTVRLVKATGKFFRD